MNVSTLMQREQSVYSARGIVFDVDMSVYVFFFINFYLLLGLTGNLIWHWHAGCFSSLKYWLMDAHVNYQSVDSFVIYCSANELSESEKHLMQCTRV